MQQETETRFWLEDLPEYEQTRSKHSWATENQDKASSFCHNSINNILFATDHLFTNHMISRKHELCFRNANNQSQ
jgi:hypothetical protein